MRTILVLTVAALLQAPEPDPQPNRLRGISNPRQQSGSWVADPARHLQQATVDSINAIIDSLERQTSAEIAVVVLDSLENLAVDQAALTLHRRWGVGKRAHDNGLVLLWSPARREISVSVGYGLEGNIPDARAGRIQDQHILPRFRSGEFDAGILSGVHALADAAREEPRARTRPGTTAQVVAAGERSRRPSALLALLLGGGALIAGLAGLVALSQHRKRHRPRPCPNGHGVMRLIPNDRDEPYLATEEALEERLGSVDHDVWVCDACESRVKVPYPRWFSGYDRCPKCERRTLLEEQYTIRAATTTSSGLVEIRQRCENCGYGRTDRRTTARLASPSASSSDSRSGSSFGGSRGSSFGGGSAGGGGASRRY